MSKLAKRLEQKTIAIANMVVDSYKVRIEAQKQNYGPVANLIAHLSLTASAESVIMCLAAQPTELFSAKRPHLDKRRVHRYNRRHKVVLVSPNRQADTSALIDAINSELAP